MCRDGYAFSRVMAAMTGLYGFFYAIFRAPPGCLELSASFRSWGALDDEEFFVIEGSEVALTPGVSPRCQATSRVHANLSLSARSCGCGHALTSSPKQQQQQQPQHESTTTQRTPHICLEERRCGNSWRAAAHLDSFVFVHDVTPTAEGESSSAFMRRFAV